jgi:hypothetical protein
MYLCTCLNACLGIWNYGRSRSQRQTLGRYLSTSRCVGFDAQRCGVLDTYEIRTIIFGNTVFTIRKSSGFLRGRYASSDKNGNFQPPKDKENRQHIVHQRFDQCPVTSLPLPLLQLLLSSFLCEALCCTPKALLRLWPARPFAIICLVCRCKHIVHILASQRIDSICTHGGIFEI